MGFFFQATALFIKHIYLTGYTERCCAALYIYLQRLEDLAVVRTPRSPERPSRVRHALLANHCLQFQKHSVFLFTAIKTLIFILALQKMGNSCDPQAFPVSFVFVETGVLLQSSDIRCYALLSCKSYWLIKIHWRHCFGMYKVLGAERQQALQLKMDFWRDL